MGGTGERGWGERGGRMAEISSKNEQPQTESGSGRLNFADVLGFQLGSL
jgi:hypothetical protein